MKTRHTNSPTTVSNVVKLLMTSWCVVPLLPLPLLLSLSSLPLPLQSSRLPLEARCQFPGFLQTKRGKQWMMNQSNTLTTFDVNGGSIFARYGTCVRSRSHSRRQSGVAECVKSNYTRLCLEPRPDNKFLVRHVESDFHDKFVCLQFIQRGVSVVQVKMSLIQGEKFVSHLCDERYMHVDPWPWISEEHYRSAHVPCPFSGGYNLHLKYSRPPPAGSYRYYGTSYYSSPSSYTSHMAGGDGGGGGGGGSQDCMDSSTAPIRMESDCVDREGVVFNFKHESCLPAGSHLAVRQRALCMATWRDGKELFAMLRADNNDRAFFCLRVTGRDPKEDYSRFGVGDVPDENDDGSIKISEVVLFIGWVCPTTSYADATRRYSGNQASSVPNLTPHMIFSVRDQQVIREPCSDELGTCHNHTSFCRHLQCMRTCGKCSAPSHTQHSEEEEGEEEEEEEEEMGGTQDGAAQAASDIVGHIWKKATVRTSDRFAVRYAKSQDGEGGLASAGEANGESMDGETLHATGGDSDYNDNDDTFHGGGGRRGGSERHGDPNSKATTTTTSSPSYQRRCSFPERVRGTWLQRGVDGSDVKIVISEFSFRHPTLGAMECVTFTPPGSPGTPLRRVLWSRYDNGCYPRFTCMHYNTPAKAVMRYRLADVQHWPLLLSDDSICDDKHFLDPPDMYQPRDKYSLRSWEVVRRAGHIHKMACILPHYLPKVVSFLDDKGRSGCLVHSTYYSPRAISLTFYPPSSTPPSKGALLDEKDDPVVQITRVRSDDDDDSDDVTRHHDASSRDVEHQQQVTGDVVVDRDGINQRGDDDHSSLMSGRVRKPDSGGDESHIFEYRGGASGGRSGASGLYTSDSAAANQEDKLEHDTWSEKFRSVKLKDDTSQPVEHHFPPGMNERQLNQTYIYINGEGGGVDDDRDGGRGGGGGGGVNYGGGGGAGTRGKERGGYRSTAGRPPDMDLRHRGASSTNSRRQHNNDNRQRYSHNNNNNNNNDRRADRRSDRYQGAVERGRRLRKKASNARGNSNRHRSSNALNPFRATTSQQQQHNNRRNRRSSSSNNNRHSDALNPFIAAVSQQQQQQQQQPQSDKRNRRSGDSFESERNRPSSSSSESDRRQTRRSSSESGRRNQPSSRNTDSSENERRNRRSSSSSNSNSDSNGSNIHHRGSSSSGRSRSERDVLKSRLTLSYECLAVMTYVDSYKSLLTVTAQRPEEILCWLVVDEGTIVILKTSQCNSETAQRVLANPPSSSSSTSSSSSSSSSNPRSHTSSSRPSSEHVHAVLRLNQGHRDCDALFPADPARPEPIEFRDEDFNTGSSGCVLTACQRRRLAVVQVVVVGVLTLLLR